jgi:ankyrin repeat protein
VPLDIFSAVGLNKWSEVELWFRAAALFGQQKLLANVRSDGPGWTPTPLLNWAVSAGHYRMVELLIQNGADVNPYASPTHGGEWPPLHDALYHRWSSIAALLIQNGAKIDAKDSVGFTALHWAVARGDAEAVRMLLKHGARVDTQADWYAVWAGHPLGDPRTFETPLHTAVERALPQMVELLLANGAPLTIRDARRRNPVDLALEVELHTTLRGAGEAGSPEPEGLSAKRVLCLKLLYRYGGQSSQARK